MVAEGEGRREGWSVVWKCLALLTVVWGEEDGREELPSDCEAASSVSRLPILWSTSSELGGVSEIVARDSLGSLCLGGVGCCRLLLLAGGGGLGEPSRPESL